MCGDIGVCVDIYMYIYIERYNVGWKEVIYDGCYGVYKFRIF